MTREPAIVSCHACKGDGFVVLEEMTRVVQRLCLECRGSGLALAKAKPKKRKSSTLTVEEWKAVKRLMTDSGYDRATAMAWVKNFGTGAL